MRTEQEMMELIIVVANSDELIRAVTLEGSRSNPAIPKDDFQDYDICYYVSDITPYILLLNHMNTPPIAFFHL